MSYKVAPELSSYTQEELIASKAGPQGTATYDEMEYDPIAQERLSAESVYKDYDNWLWQKNFNRGLQDRSNWENSKEVVFPEGTTVYRLMSMAEYATALERGWLGLKNPASQKAYKQMMRKAGKSAKLIPSTYASLNPNPTKGQREALYRQRGNLPSHLFEIDVSGLKGKYHVVAYPGYRIQGRIVEITEKIPVERVTIYDDTEWKPKTEEVTSNNSLSLRKTARMYRADEGEREWTFLWTQGGGNSVRASSLEEATQKVIEKYGHPNDLTRSKYLKARLDTLTDDPTINKRRWSDWDSMWRADSFNSETFRAPPNPYGTPKRIDTYDEQEKLRESPIFEELEKRWGYDGAMVLTNLPDLQDDYAATSNKMVGRTWKDKYKPAKDVFPDHAGRYHYLSVLNKQLIPFFRTPLRAVTRYSGSGKGFKQAYLPISYDWLFEIAENEQMGFIPINQLTKKTRSEKLMKDLTNAKGESKEIRDEWLENRKKINGNVQFVELARNKGYGEIREVEVQNWPFDSKEGTRGFAVKANKKEYLMSALANRLYLTLTRNKKSPKYRITPMEDKTMDFSDKTKTYKIAGHVGQYNSEPPKDREVPIPIHIDFKNLDDVGSFLRERYEVLSYMKPKLKRVAKNGKLMASLSLVEIEGIKEGGGFTDHAYYFPYSWSANQYGSSPIFQELGRMARQVLGFEEVSNAESFSAEHSPKVDCVNLVSKKAEFSGGGRNFYRVSFRDAGQFDAFATPAWATRAAETMGIKYYQTAGCKIVMGLNSEGKWMIQAVLIPNTEKMTKRKALKIGNHMQDRLEKEGKWAKKACRDDEIVQIYATESYDFNAELGVSSYSRSEEMMSADNMTMSEFNPMNSIIEEAPLGHGVAQDYGAEGLIQDGLSDADFGLVGEGNNFGQNRAEEYEGHSQGYNDRMDESLGMRHRGKHSQSMKDRRDEASAMDKKHSRMHRKYDDVDTMDAHGGGHMEYNAERGTKTRKFRYKNPNKDAYYYRNAKGHFKGSASAKRVEAADGARKAKRETDARGGHLGDPKGKAMMAENFGAEGGQFRTGAMYGAGAVVGITGATMVLGALFSLIGRRG